MNLNEAITWTFAHQKDPLISIGKVQDEGWTWEVFVETTLPKDSKTELIVFGRGYTLEEAIIDAAQQLPDPGPQTGTSK